MRRQKDLLEGQEVAGQLRHVVAVVVVGGGVAGLGVGGRRGGRGRIEGAGGVLIECGGGGGGGPAEVLEDVGQAGAVHVQVGGGGIFGLDVWLGKGSRILGKMWVLRLLTILTVSVIMLEPS